MEVFLAIRRKKNTIFLDCPAEGKVLDLKLMIEGITKILPENQMLWNNNKQLLDTQTFAACDINSTTANAQNPMTLALTCKDKETESWESIDIVPYSHVSELPAVMKDDNATNLPNDDRGMTYAT
ncbi:hypothetical protein SNEBB_003826 [Seison nebaliae]|nr:hypothetical protein SNEBB_003826 [Seison nebaliae]